MRREALCRITCEVYQDISETVVATLGKLGITHPYIQSGRVMVLGERGRWSFSAGDRLIGDLADIYRFTVPLESEQPVLNALISAAALDQEGRGSIYSEHIKSVLSDNAPGPSVVEIPRDCCKNYASLHRLVGIVCIVQRGQGNPIARTALEMGICVPSITYGLGAGLRDKLGLIRITIPAEKEIVSVITTHHDASGVLLRLIDAGRIDQPGQGFVFTCPLSLGLLNTRLYIGQQHAAASVGQIVTAIDEIKGSTGWRRKFAATSDLATVRRNRKYIRDLSNLTVLCREGRAVDLAKAAMDAGANGATSVRLRRTESATAGGSRPHASAWEQCTIIIPADKADAVTDEVVGAGLFDEQTQGEIYSQPCTEACTYLGCAR